MHIQNLAANTTYTFRVVAYDDLGNRGESSDTIQLSTELDTIPPVIRSFSPASSSFNSVINLSINATDNIAVDRVILWCSYDEGESKSWRHVAEVKATPQNDSVTIPYAFDVSNMPEGVIFVEAVVVDTAGNRSTPVRNTFNIKRTPPAGITNLKAVGNSGNIHLTWTVAENDVKQFEIHRALDGQSLYTRIATVNTIGYYDTTAEFGRVYSYKIIAIDVVGNKSEFSNEAVAQSMPDTEAPRVLGFNPICGSYVVANHRLSVTAVDNNQLASVMVEYRAVDCTDGIWREIGTFPMNSNHQSVWFNWNNVGLEDGEYAFQVTATDVAGNVSKPFRANFNLRTEKPSVPTLEISSDNRGISLSWDSEKDDDFSHYQLYRKTATEVSFKDLGGGTEQEFLDRDVTPGAVYVYKVSAFDRFGNRPL